MLSSALINLSREPLLHVTDPEHLGFSSIRQEPLDSQKICPITFLPVLLLQLLGRMRSEYDLDGRLHTLERALATGADNTRAQRGLK